MKKIGDFLCIIHIDAIDCITCTNISGLGEVVVIETDNTKILCEEWQSIK